MRRHPAGACGGDTAWSNYFQPSLGSRTGGPKDARSNRFFPTPPPPVTETLSPDDSSFSANILKL